MVKNATSYTGNGLRDWLIQRVSAVVLGVFLIFLTLFIVCHPQMEYAVWQGLFAQIWVKVLTFIVLLSLFAHAWIGVWTVLTDYVKPACLRVPLTVIVILALLAYLFWGVAIIWSI